MSVAYYLACIESGKYVWVGALGPDCQAMPEGQAGAVSRFALAHRGKPLVVVSDTHPILDDGKEWEASHGA
ncbi:hypothetical protein AWB79_02739 [Caballeronia hypogeia]|uniref:Uncharacterized protein n=1 Tax=Caballeronia hypogeia TaxID=1777140 RepID=A0A158ASR9_9BURK|nr:hypothetical protein AWB79_02739 [Caballeronia hypogeia]